MELLHLDSGIMGEGSASRAIFAAVVKRLCETDPTLKVIYHDLAAEPIPHMTLDAFLALERGEDVQQFLDADIVVNGAGFYTFSILSPLKAWVDRIAVKGKTFTYGENGPVGLATGKRVIVALARGNFHGERSPYAPYEHAEKLLRSIFSVVGVDVEVVVADGLGRGEEARRTAIDGALAQARWMSHSSAATARL